MAAAAGLWPLAVGPSRMHPWTKVVRAHAEPSRQGGKTAGPPSSVPDFTPIGRRDAGAGPDRRRHENSGGRYGNRGDRPPRRGEEGGAGPSTSSRPPRRDSRPARAAVAKSVAPDAADFFSSTPLRNLGLSGLAEEALEAIGVSRPSHVQAATWRAVGAGAGHVLVADHAGSGKTLAYLVPIIDTLKRDEERENRPLTTPREPRALVVAPTQELVTQVVGVAKSLCATAPLRVAAFTGQGGKWSQREMLEEGIDVLVCTPGRVHELVQEGALSFQSCRIVVLDEVDVLLGDMSEFRELVAPIQKACPPTTRFFFVTATIPEKCLDDLVADFPGLTPAVGRGLHRPAPGAVVVVVDCSGGDPSEHNAETAFRRKSEALLEALRQVPATRTLVFCNKIESCRDVENLLNRRMHGVVDVLPYHAAIRGDVRDKNLATFLTKPEGPADRRVLVCTDRASRGVDSSFVEHVVLFDFPRDPSEYIRRVGRTARGAGGRGLVTALVLGRQVPLAKEIVERNGKGLPVHRIPDIEDFAIGSRDFYRQHVWSGDAGVVAGGVAGDGEGVEMVDVGEA